MNNQIEQNVSPIMPAKVARTRRSQAEWAGLLAQWEHSGQSQKAFCESKSVCYRNFNQWKSRLKKNAMSVKPASSSPSHEFVRVSVASDAPLSSHKLLQVSLQLRNDITLTLECDISCVLTLINGLSTSSC